MGLVIQCSNYSQDSLSTEIWSKNKAFEEIGHGIAIVFIIFMLIGVPWNLAVIVTILRKCLFLQPAIMLLLNLAITDFLLCLVAMPFNVIPAIAHEYIFGDTDYVRCQFCQINGVVTNTLLLMSVYNVALLSLDRFLYVKKPLKYEEVVTVKRVVVVLVICWVLFILFCLLPVFGVGEVSLGSVVSTCTINFSEYGPNLPYIIFWVFIIAASVLPLLILLITNIWMLCIIRKSVLKKYHRARENMFDVRQGGRKLSVQSIKLKKKHKTDQLRVLQIFGAILCASILTWMPAFVSVIVLASRVIVFWLIAFGHISISSQAVIHPILQVVFLRDIRIEITKPYRYLKRKLCKHSSTPDEDGSGEITSCLRGTTLGRCCAMLDKCGANLITYYSSASTSEGYHTSTVTTDSVA